jgi:hypothetical protein
MGLLVAATAEALLLLLLLPLQAVAAWLPTTRGAALPQGAIVALLAAAPTRPVLG